ncbi:hypothetical protein KIF59_23115 [Enterobacter cloacae subsp. cloacae]|nr:hypothetical protein [Enterobacter cloacae subsp. cloacae]
MTPASAVPSTTRLSLVVASFVMARYAAQHHLPHCRGRWQRLTASIDLNNVFGDAAVNYPRCRSLSPRQVGTSRQARLS